MRRDLTSHIGAAVAATLIITAPLAATEKRIARSELPPAVEKTVAEQSQGATVRGLSVEVAGGKRTYEVALTVNGHARDVTLDEQGQILEVEEAVALDTLPASVRAALTKAAGTGTIASVESLTKRGTLVAYEAVVQTGKRRKEIQVGPHGQTLARPE